MNEPNISSTIIIAVLWGGAWLALLYLDRRMTRRLEAAQQRRKELIRTNRAKAHQEAIARWARRETERRAEFN